MEAYATIDYEDQAGRQTYRMAKNQIVIGRGGRDYWTDIKLNTLPDVSPGNTCGCAAMPTPATSTSRI